MIIGFSRRRVLALTAAVLIGAGTYGCGHQSEAPPTPPDIAAAPVRIAHTALGDVSYREVGHGPTLLLVAGFSASMDDWAPSFVDALAAHFRVVVFDDAGIGQTAPLAAH